MSSFSPTESPQPVETVDNLTLQLHERVTRTETALQEAESRYRRSERRFRVLSGVLLGAITITTVLPFLSPAVAQGYSVTLTSLAARVVALETKTASMSVLTDPNTSQPTVRFSDVNVQIVSGSGGTNFTANGRGNLIIGYNELRGNGDDRSGSHNLIVGVLNNYSINAKSGLVVGFQSDIGGLTSIALGCNNQALGSYSTVTGGIGNKATGIASSVSGGAGNEASSYASSISGGTGNEASNGYTSVSGGVLNVASGEYSSLSGGYGNVASGGYSSVSGGRGNPAQGDFSSISGGFANTAQADYSSISGGSGTVANQNFMWVGGGYHTP